MNLARCLDRWAGRTPDGIALRCAEEELTYAELDLWASGVAAGLAESGVVEGGRMAVFAGSNAELVVIDRDHTTVAAAVPLFFHDLLELSDSGALDGLSLSSLPVVTSGGQVARGPRATARVPHRPALRRALAPGAGHRSALSRFPGTLRAVPRRCRRRWRRSLNRGRSSRAPNLSGPGELMRDGQCGECTKRFT